MCISVPLHSDKTSPSALLEELLFLPRSLGGSEIQSFSSLFVFKVSLSKTFRLGGHLHNNVHNPQEPPHPKTPQRLSVCGKSTANNWMSSQECIPKECWRVTGNSGRRFLFVCFFSGGFFSASSDPFLPGMFVDSGSPRWRGSSQTQLPLSAPSSSRTPTARWRWRG